MLPIGTTSIWLRPSAYGLWEFEVLLDPSDGETWRFRRDTAVTLPLDEALVTEREIRFAKLQVVLAYAAAERADGCYSIDEPGASTAPPKRRSRPV